MKSLRDYQRDAFIEKLRRMIALSTQPSVLLRGLMRPLSVLSVIKELLEPLFDVKYKLHSSEAQINLYRNSLRQLALLANVRIKPLTLDEFLYHPVICGYVNNEDAIRLKALLDFYGSDKASSHNYNLFYQPILCMTSSVCQGRIKLMEIGLGTNNIDIRSNMGKGGRPGASVRAFRDYLPEASIYGADIDRRILFSEDRIDTSWVDQLSTQSLRQLLCDNYYHIIVDDGLHTSEANLNTLQSAIGSILPGGWIVIEDISPDDDTLNMWLAVSSMLSDEFNAFLVETLGAYVFLANKKAYGTSGQRAFMEGTRR